MKLPPRTRAEWIEDIAATVALMALILVWTVALYGLEGILIGG